MAAERGDREGVDGVREGYEDNRRDAAAVGVIDGFRWCILKGESEFYLPGFLLSISITGLFLWLGIRQFRKMERTFAAE